MQHESIGQVFGMLTVIGYEPGSKLLKTRSQRICKCECGTVVNKTDKQLLRNNNPSCGCALSHNKPTKICPKCKVDKDKSEYHKLASKKLGIQTICKECISKERKEIYWANPAAAIKKTADFKKIPENAAKIKEYYQKNKLKYNERYRKYMADEEKVKRKEQVRIKYKEGAGKEKSRLQKQEYSRRPEVKERRKINHHIRKGNDLTYLIKRRLRFRLRHIVKALKNKKYKYKSAVHLLGCDMTFFKQYIESTFKDGISWDNFSDWDIDHIKPCAKFDLTKIEEQKICFHYSNLQALMRVDNQIKGMKYDGL